MYNEIDFQEYQDNFQDTDVDYQLIDVREVDEYVEGHLPNAVNIPLSEFQVRFSEISKDTPVVLVCARGGRSGQASDFLTYQGYDGDKVNNLMGGTLGWMMAGLPIEK